ncbi:hypothetical protein [Cupriavidus sp. D384]|uniref:hypothetical protein n=1 Tax=Cupriavidus sp. D384 TaxID=1538095 RepID=UPI000AAD6B1D|nr:hypothetical protein [Cupriavidus sp. D384]
MTNRRSASQTALLIAINAKLYEAERGRQVTRYRFSHATLRRLSGRKALRGSFLEELGAELEELDWLFFRLAGEFAVIALDKSESWVKLGSKRLTDHLAMTDGEIETAYDELHPMDDDSEGVED